MGKAQQRFYLVATGVVLYLPFLVLLGFLTYVLVALLFQYNLPNLYRVFNLLPVAGVLAILFLTTRKIIRSFNGGSELRKLTRSILFAALVFLAASFGIVCWIITFLRPVP